jgi:hypothetical protein
VRWIVRRQHAEAGPDCIHSLAVEGRTIVPVEEQWRTMLLEKVFQGGGDLPAPAIFGCVAGPSQPRVSWREVDPAGIPAPASAVGSVKGHRRTVGRAGQCPGGGRGHDSDPTGADKTPANAAALFSWERDIATRAGPAADDGASARRWYRATGGGGRFLGQPEQADFAAFG